MGRQSRCCAWNCASLPDMPARGMAAKVQIAKVAQGFTAVHIDYTHFFEPDSCSTSSKGSRRTQQYQGSVPYGSSPAICISSTRSSQKSHS